MSDFRVYLKDSPNVSPFPCHRWPTQELAEKFCESDEAGQWKSKLIVRPDVRPVPEDEGEGKKP